VPWEGSHINGPTNPRAMPWADLFGPFRTKSEECECRLRFRQLASGFSLSVGPLLFICEIHTKNTR
jgi:hypothetical protein